MPTWIERPPNRKFPWIPILSVMGLGLLLVATFWGLRHRSPRTALMPTPPSPSVIVSSGTIGMNGSLSDSMRQAGVPPFEAAQIERTLKPLFNPRYSKPKHSYEIIRSTSGHFIQMTYRPNAFEYFSVNRSTAGVFTASSGKIQSEQTVAGVNGQIQGSLWDAMSRQGVPPEMIIRFAELFSWRMDFLTEPRVGDSYKMVWRRSSGNGAIRDEDILCAAYISHERGELYAFPLAGEYYDAEGNSLRGEFLRAPLVYRRISSYFTEHRYHPILRYYRPHHGIDYAAPFGTPASSIADGVVISKGYEGGLGNEIRVRHSGSYVSIYGHLRGYPREIHIGSHVKQGQVIGYVGSTGLSTGPHLHFGFERDGQLINFFKVKLNNMRKTIPPAERQHFEAIKKQAFALFAQLTQPGGTPLQVLKSN